MTTLREAAQQALEALEFMADEWGFTQKANRPERWQAIDALRAALAHQDEPDLSRCPQCNGPADNGFDRSIPPSPYLCTKCMAEPVEPIAWMVHTVDGQSAYVTDNPTDLKEGQSAYALYPGPFEQVLLTDEEILKAIGWERAEMYMKLAPNFPVDEAKQETLKNARAVERAVWEKNHG
jgi:hypothetical protein